MKSSTSSTPEATSDSPSDGTRTRILDVAEAAFADNGIDATSLRALTRVAGVNVAAIHYHFGSKDGLLDAVVARRASDVTEARLRALSELEAPDAEALEVGEILRAYVEPAVRRASELGERGFDVARLLARLQTERSDRLEDLRREHLADVHARFVAALCRALPAVDRSLIEERFQIALGCIYQAFTSLDRTPPRARSDAEWVAMLVDFVSAGLAGRAQRQGRAA